MRTNLIFQQASRAVWLLMLIVLCSITLLRSLWSVPATQAFDWIPTNEEIQKYRKSWNPLSNGPIFLSGVDVHPQGQFTAHPFIFSQISEKRFGNQLTDNRMAASVHTYQVAPVVTMAYGLTNHVELNLGLSGSSWWANSSDQFNRGTVALGQQIPGSVIHRSISNIAPSSKTQTVGAPPSPPSI